MASAGFDWSTTSSIFCILTGATPPVCRFGERKAFLQLLVADIPGAQFNDHETGDGERIRRHACGLGFEGVVFHRRHQPVMPRGASIKITRSSANLAYSTPVYLP